MHRARAVSSVVLLDLNVVVDVLDAFCLTRNGHSLVDCFLGSGATAQPHHAVLVRIDMNTPQAGDMFGGQLGFDLRRDGRILYEDLRLRAVRIRILRQGDGGPDQHAADQTGYCKFRLHGFFLQLSDLRHRGRDLRRDPCRAPHCGARRGCSCVLDSGKRRHRCTSCPARDGVLAPIQESVRGNPLSVN